MLPSMRRLLVALLLISMVSSFAADHSLSAFRASYNLFRNDKQVGESFLHIEKGNNRLSMQMITKPSGLYALITNLQPVTETTLIRAKGDFRLSTIRIFTNLNENPQEVVELDWQKDLLTSNRKSKQYQLPLTEEVYDYLSIHWLAAQMSLADADLYQLKFYRKGKLSTSTLLRSGTETLEINGKKIQATVFEQSFKGSSRHFKYHYDRQNPWLPLRIERTKKGKKTTVLLLKSVDELVRAE
ncbi:MAG: DUF3108 domain-containing protein [Gammaproteobacteria bacterium]|nr:DUF3108 domain-containing protein [Gammaproteobacteria bacterium]